jgi:membrane-bound lytic murein transglycosylase B
MLDAVAARYGVPARYLVAFWGMETNYGAHLGSFPVIDSLATLAYDERRAAFFRTQLLHALHIVDDGHIRVANMRGSWAGAMGHMQFLPSTFVDHAVDATGDGRKDIWGTLRDAFASGANYLDSLGWAGDERWGREVVLPADFPYAQAQLDVTKSLAAWADMGVKRADGGALPVVDGMQGSIVLPQGHEGPAFMVYDNFRAILHWNRSVNYAIAVGYLADRIVGLPKIRNGRDVANAPMAREDLLTLQERLNALGFDAGPVDGLPGPQTRAAIRRFQAAAGLPRDGHPTPALLDKLEAYAQQRADGSG